MALCTRFGRGSFGLRSHEPLTNDQLIRVAPSIFAAEKHTSRSDRYTYIPTIDVLNGLRKEGFQPFMAVQSRSRIPGKSDFTKHMLRLRRPGEIQLPETFEVILINSHDGTSSYQMLCGVFRFVCQNGMVVGDTIEDVRVPHRGNITDNVIDAAYTIMDSVEPIQQSMERFKGVPLALPEAAVFAESALSLKYDEDSAPITAGQLLKPRRVVDQDNSLWATFNRVQENLLKGGLRGLTTTGKRTTTREVTSIDNNVKLNKALWTLTEKMASLKGA
ncbi:MAG: DUF932 domain-containing protein [Veillonellales bacterium]